MVLTDCVVRVPVVLSMVTGPVVVGLVTGDSPEGVEVKSMLATPHLLCQSAPATTPLTVKETDPLVGERVFTVELCPEAKAAVVLEVVLAPPGSRVRVPERGVVLVVVRKLAVPVVLEAF